MQHIPLVYKIMTHTQWEDAQTKQDLRIPLDLKDGFIHLSSAAQLAGTLTRFFADFQSLVILEIPTHDLGHALQWETAKADQTRPGTFPHYHGMLTPQAISRCWSITRDFFQLPLELLDQAETEMWAKATREIVD